MTLTQFDTWNNLFDNTAKPLVGKLVFKDKATKQDTDVYDNEGNNLGATVYVNGVTDYQVFLDNDKEYTAYLYKYIGSGSFRTDTNDSNFMLVRTIDFIPNGSGSIITNNDILWGIDALQAINTDNLSEGYTVQVAGYYGIRAGNPNNFDSSEVFLRTYTWSPNSELPNDGGVVIGKTLQTGKWILDMNLPYIDVRWYGVIASENKSDMSRIANAAYAATLWKKDLYFPAGVYTLDGSNAITLSGKIITDNGVVFGLVKNPTSITCEDIESNTHQLFHGNVGLNLTSKTLKTSWVEGVNLIDDLTHIGMTIIDNDTERLISGKFIVEPGHTLTKVRLNGAITTSKGFLKAGTIMNCVIKEDWFITKDVSKFNISDCIIDNSSFIDKSFYVDLMNKVSNPNYGDMGGYAFESKLLLPNANIRNMSGNLTLQGSANISGFAGTINTESPTTELDLTITDSHCSVNAGKVNNLVIKNSTITNPTIIANAATIENSSLTANDLSTLRLRVKDLYVDSCRLNKIYLTCLDNNGVYAYTVKNCSFYNDAAIYEEYESSNVLATVLREAVIINNTNVKLIDTASRVTKLGSAFRWDNNGDEHSGKIQANYIGVYSSSSGSIPWVSDETTQCAQWRTDYSANTFYTTVWRLNLANKQPWSLPSNSLRYKVEAYLERGDEQNTTGTGKAVNAFNATFDSPLVHIVHDSNESPDDFEQGTAYYYVTYEPIRG